MSTYLSGDLVAVLNEQVVNEAFEIVRTNKIGLLSVIGGSGEPVRPFEGYKMSWMEMDVNADGSTVTADVAVSDTTVPVADGSMFRAGTPFSPTGSDEVVLITAVAGNDLTVVRGFGSTTPEAIASGVKLTIDSHSREENSLTVTDNIKQGETVNNYFQTIDTAIEMSRRSLATMQYGDTNDMAFQISERIRQLAIELNRILIRGRRDTATIEGDLRTYCGGLRFFTDQAGAIKSDAAGQTLTLEMINDVNAEIVTAGGTANVITVGIPLARKLSSLVSENYDSQRLADWKQDEGSVMTLPSDLPLVGNVNTIVVDTNLNDDELLILNTSKIGLKPMASGNAQESGVWTTKDATVKGQDGQTVRILGDFSFEIRDSKSSIGRLHNLG